LTIILNSLRIILMRSPATLLRRHSLTSGTLLMTGCLALSGCSAASDDGSGADLRVAAAFYPLQYVAQRVAGDHADVENLTEPGGEPHDLELTIRQTAELARADLVVYEHGFQPAVDDAVTQNATAATLDAADVADLVPFGHDGHDDSSHTDSEGESHDEGDLDPHFWQDPLRLAAVGDAVAAELAEVDPDHESDYQANAAALRADLEGLDKAYADGLASCARDTIVVSHDAFGYLAKYDLKLEPIAGLSPDAEPTPADLGRLQSLIGKKGVTTVFAETLVSPKLAETLAHDLGIASAVLDPIEGLTDQTADQDYLSLMRSNLAALEKANGC